MATDVEKLVIAIQTVGLDKAEKELKKLKDQAVKADTATDNLANTAQKSNRVF